LENKSMSCNYGQQTKKTVRVQHFLATALMLACALGMVIPAAAQSVTPPPTPDTITPEAGNSAFLFGHGVGTQGYICLPTSPGASTAAWNANNARPEATLFVNVFGKDVQIITHFLSPDTKPSDNAPKPLPFGSVTWQSSFDSSKVWAQKVNSIPAGTHPSCPNDGAIACVLLESIGTEQGPAGGKLLTKTTFIQRLNTRGGLPPADGCFVSTDVGKQALAPYSADYFFFRANE
jgi:hypothetical protein